MNFDTIVQVFDIVSSVVGVAAMIAALTPTPADDSILAVVRKVLDFVGGNFLHAKNK